MGSVWYRPRQVPHHHDFNLSSDNDIWLAKTIIPTNNESCESYHYQNTCLVTFNILSLSFFRPFLCSPDNRKKKKKTSSDTPSLLQGVERRVWVGFCEVFIWAASPWPPWGKDLLVSVCLHSHLACSLHSSFLFPVTFRSVLRFCFFGVFLLSSKCFLGFSLTGLFFFLPAFFCRLLFLSLPFNFWTPALWIKRAIWFLLPCCAAPNILKQVCIESNYIQNNLGESRMKGPTAHFCPRPRWWVNLALTNGLVSFDWFLLLLFFTLKTSH